MLFTIQCSQWIKEHKLQNFILYWSHCIISQKVTFFKAADVRMLNMILNSFVSDSCATTLIWLKCFIFSPCWYQVQHHISTVFWLFTIDGIHNQSFRVTYQKEVNCAQHYIGNYVLSNMMCNSNLMWYLQQSRRNSFIIECLKTELSQR